MSKADWIQNRRRGWRRARTPTVHAIGPIGSRGTETGVLLDFDLGEPEPRDCQVFAEGPGTTMIAAFVAE